MPNANQNKTAGINQDGETIKEKIRELADAIKGFNETATALRDALRSPVSVPFKLDPTLNLSIILGDFIPINRWISLEIFGRKYLEITDIKVEGQSITIFFKDENEKSLIYNVVLHEGIETIERWEVYLLSLIASHVVQAVNEERKKAETFLETIRDWNARD
jgi:hypothetical protein